MAERLINADDIPYVTDETYLHEYDYAYRYAIDALPTVDAVPVVRGRWKEVRMSERTGYNPALSSYYDPVYGHVCSLCGGDAIINDCGDELLTEYCPYCGCKMEGE